MTSLGSRLGAIGPRVREFYSPTREPLRRHVYTTLLAIMGFAVTAGLLTGTTLLAVSGPLAFLLAVPAVEKARSLVTPVAAPVFVDDVPGKHAPDRLP